MANPLKGCKVKRSTVERLQVIGPTEKGLDVLKHLFDLGYRVTRSGPYTNQKMFPNVDRSRFLYDAERKIKS